MHRGFGSDGIFKGFKVENNQRNMITAVVLIALLMLGWELGLNYFYPQPEKPPVAASAAAGAEAPAKPKPTREGGLTDPAEIALEQKDLDQSLGSKDRVIIDSPEVRGSINPVGARIDDLTLKTHRQSVEKDSGPVRLFSPQGTPAQQFAQFGFIGDNVSLPGPDTVWTVAGGPLSPGKPVTLTWNNAEGLLFTIALTIDEHYMITAQQTVANTGPAPVAVKPFALINRTSATASLDTWTVHSGPIGAFDGSVDFGNNYDDVAEKGTVSGNGAADWIGFTDIYWLSALIPQDGARTVADFRSLGDAKFRADVIYDAVTVPAGKQVSRTTRLFAGAKESHVLDQYEEGGIANFGLAIDWGWFRWFEKPIFWLLTKLFDLVGNFGVAIILLTVIVRGVMFPIAQRQFASMAAMKAVQPKMKALQERYKDDKQMLQSKMMELYREEKVNPLAGCLPMFLQIPVFYALYKVLMVAIEMRHQPFILWIRDLSAPDPLHILNLFGLLDFNPPGFLAIGVLAILLGITMWLQFKLNPAQMDPAQQQIFMLMPWFMMFVMAPFAAGLLIYWITSNLLTIGQQKLLYARHPQLKAAEMDEKKEKLRADLAAEKATEPKAGRAKTPKPKA
ncbi:membrane protein insertase YidC [Croceicoccus sp. BE223]|uniref:membrane protein insertase YidC n=1 Tax=Croceicoccus sp. BE223 TaxID=2817716 RepID=UPI00285C8FA8|nr:membrane protein insertase YidC [Croceicoccus sp. BE223]MDR7100919.1 YidC/Oxa1 family membrane protein insertase [Croceicoccus sp. BE223]